MVMRSKGDDEYKEPDAVPGAQKVPEKWELLLPIRMEGKPKKPNRLPNLQSHFQLFPASGLGIIKHLSKERLSGKRRRKSACSWDRPSCPEEWSPGLSFQQKHTQTSSLGKQAIWRGFAESPRQTVAWRRDLIQAYV